MKRTLVLLQVFAISCGVILPPNEARTAAPPVEVFASLPRLADLEISPNGVYVAARMTLDNLYRVAVLKETGGQYEIVYVLNENDEFSTKWFHWANDNTLLLSFGFSQKRGRDLKTDERRLYALRMNDKALEPLFQRRARDRGVQIEDRIVSFMMDDPEHILVQYNRDDPSKPNVYKVTVNDRSRHRLLVPGKPTVRNWMTDNSDMVRIGTGISGDGDRTLYFRLDGDDKWLDFSHRVAEAVFRPVGFTSEPNIVYVISGHETDPAGLYTFNIEADEFVDKIYSHPTVDIRRVAIDNDTGRLINVGFVDDDIETVWFDKREINQHINGLANQLNNSWLTTYAIAENGQHAILRAKGSRDAGQYLVLNTAERKVTFMPPQYDVLNDATLGVTVPTEYQARDGLTIPAFITLPPGIASLEQAKGLPFVLNPHGGPTSRDFLRFSFDVQFLASRGYGVLQMNFRGSSGYGEAFREAGDREWGQAMQDDISDGARWLIEQGYADPERIAISGGSYGGYAALMGIVKTPDLYQCAISFAGVADLPDLIERQRAYVDGRHATRFIGRLWRDRKMLAENSPAQRAEDIQVPVLLMHGTEDTIVDIEQSELMAERLAGKKKPHEFVVFEQGDHYLSRYENRLRYLQETEGFLSRCIGSGVN